jgi:iron(III) transport system substrate-binding protein
MASLQFAAFTFSICCIFLAAAGAHAASVDWRADFERTIQAAKNEGRVVVLLLLGQVYRDAVLPFERAYPGIQLEAIGGRGRDLTPRIRAERESGQYLWDVFLNASETGDLVFKPRGYLAPLRPTLILPEVVADDKWLGGFDDGWIDEENRYLYAYLGRITRLFYVNRDLVPENQLNTVEQLVEPRWKGKIITDDPRRPGPGSANLGHLLMVLGENWVRRFLANDPVIVDNPRQLAEFVYRGRYPIAMDLRSDIQWEFKKHGLTQVKPLAPESETGGRLGMSRVAALFDRAPHPNAAKVFLNWYLTRDAQQHATNLIGENSRRLDVVGPAETAPDPKTKYRSVNKGKYMHLIDKAMEISKESLGKTR